MSDLHARKDLERGTTVGRYVVLGRLGEGGIPAFAIGTAVQLAPAQLQPARTALATL